MTDYIFKGSVPNFEYAKNLYPAAPNDWLLFLEFETQQNNVLTCACMVNGEWKILAAPIPSTPNCLGVDGEWEILAAPIPSVPAEVDGIRLPYITPYPEKSNAQTDHQQVMSAFEKQLAVLEHIAKALDAINVRLKVKL